MTHHLISMLGKSNKVNGSYRQACYNFDGKKISSCFFGMALAEQIKPDNIIICGTSGSMWDVMLEDLELGDHLYDEREQLMDAVNSNNVLQPLLNKFAPVMSEKLGINCQLQLIPYGLNTDEQLETVNILAQHFSDGDMASLDLTHGLRHLPMLILMSAFYLQYIRHVNVNALYYGALDLTENNITPVMKLNGLLQVANWIQAIHTFDKDGDYSVFSQLLSHAGMAQEDVQLLEQAAYYERITNAGQARGKVKKFIGVFEPEILDSVAQLFSPVLRKRLEWSTKDSLYQRQRALANVNLQQGDYLRATIYAFEAFISRLVRESGQNNINNRDVRQQAKEQFEQKTPRPSIYQEYLDLRELRNILAHGNATKFAGIQQILDDEKKMESKLSKLIKDLLPDD